MENQLFSDFIRQYTRHEHAALEKKLVGMIKSIRSTDQYISLLQMFYGYYHTLERAMDRHLTDPVFAGRRKAAAILKDIHDLEGRYSTTSQEVIIPDINSYPQALGAAYVLEGSTLGGIIIAKMISDQLQVPPDTGFSFFNGYGALTEEMWKKFRTVLDSLPPGPDRELAANAADKTFLTFKDWAMYYEPVFKI